jgi:putative CocE/NonD family hydrolase
VIADLFASTTGSDADWIVKLIDVYPEQHPENWELAGYQLMVSNEVFRGRYRKGFEKPEPITPDTVLEYRFSLHTQNYTFKKGHRLMVQVQSTWFPLIDRNPQTFVESLFQAKPEDFQKQTHRVHRSAQHASHVVLPVVVRGAN